MTTMWTGQETFPCYCGKPAGVVLENGVPMMLCFAHTRDSGLFVTLPKERPSDWDTWSSPSKDEVMAHVGDKQHPLVLSWVANRRRVYEVVQQGFEEDHPQVITYLSLHKNLCALNSQGEDNSEAAESIRSEMDVLWDDMDEDEVDYIRSHNTRQEK